MPNVAEIIKDHVTLEVRCIDRLYLNAYVPRLQTSGGVIDFLVRACRQKIASPAVFGQLTDAFKARLRRWAPLSTRSRGLNSARGNAKTPSCSDTAIDFGSQLEWWSSASRKNALRAGPPTSPSQSPSVKPTATSFQQA